MAKVLISIPYARCLKTFLDTPIYRELRARHSVTIVSYLADCPGFAESYGGPAVGFQPGAMIHGRLRRAAYALFESHRVMGFLFRWRKRHTWLPWHALLNTSGNVRRRRPWVRAALWLISVIGDRVRMDEVLKSLLGGWIFQDKEVDHLFRTESPDVLVCTSHGSEQEAILCHLARKYGVATILAPNTLDAFLFHGFLAHRYDRICAAGPKDRWLLEHLHGYPPDRIVDLGVISNRYYSSLASEERDGGLRQRLRIGSDARILYYLSVAKAYYTDLLPALDHLLDAIKNGRLADTVIVIRAAPGDDVDVLRRRYGEDPRMRIQIAGPKSVGMVDCPDFTKDVDAEHVEFVETLRDSAVVVMSATTSAFLHAATFGIPTIANVAELSAYPTWSVSPRRNVAWDGMGMFAMGLPVARTLDQLVDKVAERFADPNKDEAVWERILEQWDYQNERYVDDFLDVVARS